jgi:tetratricopeptide (TPR) repeat protein
VILVGLAVTKIAFSPRLGLCCQVPVSGTVSDAPQTASQGLRKGAPSQETKHETSTPADPEWLTAEELVRQEKWKDGENALRQYLKTHPDSSEPHALLGWVLFKEGRAPESLHEYTVAAKYRKPSAFELKIVALNYATLGDLQNADKWLTTSLAWNPSDLQGCIRLGEIKELRLRLDEAVDVLHQCLTLDPRNSYAANALGVSYENLGHFDEAVGAFRNAIAWQSKKTTPDPTPSFNLGRVLLKEDKPQEALPYLRTVVKLLPENAEAHEQLGRAYIAMDQLQLGQSEIEKAINLAPELPRLHYLLGQLYRKEGQGEKARIELDRYTALKAAHPRDGPYQ